MPTSTHGQRRLQCRLRLRQAGLLGAWPDGRIVDRVRQVFKSLIV